MDSNFHAATEVTYHHEPSGSTKRIWKTTILLSILTIIELGLGLTMYATEFPEWVDMFLKGVIVILTLAKAFYIISIFMHLGDEIRNMIMTLAMPVLLFVWFIGAFLWDGGSYRSLRNRYDPYYKESTLQKHDVKAADTSSHPLH
jgi:cytochrome c oxidase subunit IV